MVFDDCLQSVQIKDSPGIEDFNMKTVPDDICTIYSLSRYLYPLLQQQGYTGSERTLRNHLSSQPYIKAFLEKNKYFEHGTQENVCVEKEDLCYRSKTPKI